MALFHLGALPDQVCGRSRLRSPLGRLHEPAQRLLRRGGLAGCAMQVTPPVLLLGVGPEKAVEDCGSCGLETLQS